MAASVHSAGVQDRDGAKPLLAELYKQPRLQAVLADGAYSGKLQTWFYRKSRGKRLIVVKRPDSKKFIVIPKRWIVERFFGWINWQRRLSKDYEHNPDTSRSRLFIADINLLSKRILKLYST